jgi:hypothetical protein
MERTPSATPAISATKVLREMIPYGMMTSPVPSLQVPRNLLARA